MGIIPGFNSWSYQSSCQPVSQMSAQLLSQDISSNKIPTNSLGHLESVLHQGDELEMSEFINNSKDLWSQYDQRMVDLHALTSPLNHAGVNRFLE
jgi:hypothetical protein